MSSDEKNTEIVETPVASYDEEIAQLRDALKSVREELASVRKDNDALRAENRKYFYESVKTGVPDDPPAPEPEPAPPTLDELVGGFGDIIKNGR